MKQDHTARLLEIGLGLFGALLLGGFGVLVFGRLGGYTRVRAGNAEATPPEGSVPAPR